MKIVLVCESFSSRLSGGKVVRYLHDILSSHGHDVRVAITSPFDEQDTRIEGGKRFIVPIPTGRRYYRRLYALANPYDVPPDFERLLDDFAPEVVHFASFDHTKSPNLYRLCKSRNVRTVLQPWTMHFYCAQGFGYLRDKNCNRCLQGGFSTAIAQGCTDLRGAVGQLERAVMHRVVPSAADVLLSSNVDLDQILSTYGVPREKIQYFPVAFDTRASVAAGTPTTRGDYYIYYGQAASHKGTDFLIELFSELPDRQLRIYPMAPFSAARTLPPNIRIIPGLGWDTGLREAIAHARAVLVPSLWMTSTEYSLCEAMIMGKPVVAFDTGAHKNMLSHRETAMVVPIHDKVGFKAALDELEADPALYDKLVAAGTARIKEINAPERLHAQLMIAYGSASAS